jgi:catechol 2,3-dioxygenase-like lactoylglutathione lyase family enzyme
MQLDHLILAVNDRQQSIDFFTNILGLSYEGEPDPFSVIRVTEACTLQLAPWGTSGGEHLAFAMSRSEFDRLSAGQRRGSAFWRLLP